MTTEDIAAPSPPPKLNPVGFAAVSAALREGARDFLRAPAFGLFFAAFYVIGGLVIFAQLQVLAQSWWVIPLGLGFPLLGPFAAVGLYEVSRRLEGGDPHIDTAFAILFLKRSTSRTRNPAITPSGG